MTPFHRLALLFGTTAYMLGVALLYVWLGYAVAFAVVTGGIVVALVVTLEFAPRSPAAPETGTGDAGEPGADDWTIRRRDRKEIERSAELAREAREE